MFLFQDRLTDYFKPIHLNAPFEGRARLIAVFGLGLLPLFYAVVAVLIFNFHHYITRIVNSDDICTNQFMYEAMSWLLPKAARHCDMLLTAALYYNPRKGILTVLDLWILFIFLIQTFIGVGFLYVRHGKRKAELSKVFRDRRMLAINGMLLVLFPFLINIYLVFFWIPLIDEPWERRPWLNMLSDYHGIGAGILSFSIGGLSFISNAGISMGLWGLWENFRNQKQAP